MFCIKCGKKVPDIALFCPYCGTAVEIPGETDDLDTALRTPEPAPVAKEDFIPLSFDRSPEEEPEDSPAPASGAVPPLPDEEPLDIPRERPLRFTGKAPDLTRSSADTLFGEEQNDADAAYDADYDRDYRKGRDQVHGKKKSRIQQDRDDDDDADQYEEREEGGFLVRHIRGIVALGLSLLLVLILFIWASTSSGQKVLAKIDLAWTSSAYAALGKDAYDAGSYRTASSWYEKAFDREASQVYAINAGVSCSRAGDTETARQWFITAIKTDPRESSGYLQLLSTYTDISQMSTEVKNLIRQGYTMTGDERLNIG